MAMLAEPRRKQKISIDPRNRFWSDDKSKFGKRMLEKMGWETGKGLGANLDGNTDHVKVSLKNNQLGVGCTASHDDDWIAHQDDFNDILSNLNQDHGKEDDEETKDDNVVESLEEKSKKSKSRVHYKKFTRGKDLSKYGAVDIDCIFGKRSNSAPVTPKSLTPKIQSTTNSDDEDTHEEHSHGITTVTNNTSIQDYFAKKMADIKKARQSAQNVVTENVSGGENKEGSNQEEELDEGLDCEVKKSKKKKRKNKRKNKDLNENQHDAAPVPEAETGDLLEDRSAKKQKKRKRVDIPNDENDENMRAQGEKSSSSDEVENVEGSPRKKMNKGRADGDMTV